MPKCVTEDYTLTVPSDWVDRSMITWVAPNNAKRKVMPNILCSNDHLQDGETLDSFVNRQLKELMNKVTNFDLIKREKTTFGGKDAVILQFTMKPQNVPLRQQQIYFVPDPKGKKVSTVVATAANADFADLEKSFDKIFASVSWNT